MLNYLNSKNFQTFLERFSFQNFLLFLVETRNKNWVNFLLLFFIRSWWEADKMAQGYVISEIIDIPMIEKENNRRTNLLIFVL